MNGWLTVTIALVVALAPRAATFDDVHARLAAGRTYENDVPRGELAWQTIISGGARLPTTVIVPEDYNPQQKYPVRVYLHGGIARQSIERQEQRTPRRRLEDRRSSSTLEEHNTLEFTDPPVKEEVFRRRRASGRVDLERDGNIVRARTRGVGAFTLLLSPSEFDFDKPIRVFVNDRPVFDGVVTKDVQTLNKWASRDEDRTMLFAAELRIDVPAAETTTRP